MSRPSKRAIAVGALLLLVVALRLLFLAEVKDRPLFLHPLVDAQVYDGLARRIAGGEGYPLSVFATNPFYPYFLAAFYALLGSAVYPVVFFQLLLGGASAFLLYRIGRRIGGFLAGSLALLLFGLYRPEVFFEGFLLPTAAGVFIDLFLLDRLLARRPGGPARGLLVPGLLLGLGALVQGNLILLLPFLIGWLLFTERKGKRALPVLLLVAGFLIPVLPVTARNMVLGKDLVLVSSHGGVNFYMGNNASASGVFAFPEEEIVLTPENINIHDSKRIAEERTGRRLKPSEVSWYWTKRGLSWIAGDPAGYVELLARKTVLFWNGIEIPDNADLYFHQERVRTLRAFPIMFGLLAPLGILGMVRLFRERRGAPLLLFLGAQFLSVLLFYIHSRYRMPFAAALAAPAALGLVTLVHALRRWRWSGRIWLVGALALLFVLINHDLLGPDHAAARAFSLTHLGNALHEAGDRDEAEAAFLDALRLLPGHATAEFNLGRLYQAEGRLREASERYRAAVREIPTFAEAYMNLGVVHRALGENERAVVEYREAVRLRPDYWPARYNLGNALQDLERYDEAAGQYELAASMEPKDVNIVRNLANAYERMGDLAAAEKAVREGLGRIGREAELRDRLGDLLEKQGREEEAMAEYRRSVEIDPRYSVAWNDIGLLLYHQGKIEEALETWRKILAYDSKSPVIQNVRMAEEALESKR
ncbi:MAG: tetratricopeptide repeat protein [Candidatus Eisenbacteria bacterium]